MPDDVEGGDQVCWLDQLCPECGAMPTDDPTDHPTGDPGRCWRCGADRRVATQGGDPAAM